MIYYPGYFGTTSKIQCLVNWPRKAGCWEEFSTWFPPDGIVQHSVATTPSDEIVHHTIIKCASISITYTGQSIGHTFRFPLCWCFASCFFLGRPQLSKIGALLLLIFPRKKISLSVQIDPIHNLPLKHVLAPQNDFGMPKIIW